MQVIIDRLEGRFAVVELPDGKMLNVPIELFSGANEGSVVDIVVNEQAAEKRQKSIVERFNKLKKS